MIGTTSTPTELAQDAERRRRRAERHASAASTPAPDIRSDAERRARHDPNADPDQLEQQMAETVAAGVKMHERAAGNLSPDDPGQMSIEVALSYAAGLSDEWLSWFIELEEAGKARKRLLERLAKIVAKREKVAA